MGATDCASCTIGGVMGFAYFGPATSSCPEDAIEGKVNGVIEETEDNIWEIFCEKPDTRKKTVINVIELS